MCTLAHTYAHRHSNVQEATPVKAPPVEAEVSVAPPLPGRPGLGDRVNTIEIKTVLGFDGTQIV